MNELPPHDNSISENTQNIGCLSDYFFGESESIVK